MKTGVWALAVVVAIGGLGLQGCGSSGSGGNGQATQQQTEPAENGTQATTPAAQHDTWVVTADKYTSTYTPAGGEASTSSGTATFEYDEHGNRTKSVNVDEPGDGDAYTYTTTSTFDEHGFETSSETTSDAEYSTPQKSTCKNEYDKDGRLTKVVVSREGITNMGDETYLYEYYDSGNVKRVTSSYTDTMEGAEATGASGYVHENTQTLEYDEAGILQTQHTLIVNKEDGSTINDSTITYAYEYDDQGRPVSYKATSSDGQTSTEWSATYDEQGNIASETYINTFADGGSNTFAYEHTWTKVDNPSEGAAQRYHISRYR